ncbi:MAG: hypothetical protein ACI89U_002615, partial [Gammaproteobacteria bacterium]
AIFCSCKRPEESETPEALLFLHFISLIILVHYP